MTPSLQEIYGIVKNIENLCIFATAEFFSLFNSLLFIMKPFILIFSLFCFLFASARTVSLNDGWQFRLSSSDQWEPVTIPHTWNTDAYKDKDYIKGKGIYRRVLTLQPEDSLRKFYLRLEGASKSSEVLVNGKHVQTHKGGYTESVYPLSEYLTFSSPNEIEIIVENESEDTPPISGDFTFFGGIYRDVWLEDYDPLHFALQPFATRGVKLTPSIEYDLGAVKVDAAITNEDSMTRQGSLVIYLYDPQGNLIETAKKDFKANGGSLVDLSHKFDYILRPQLWSPDSPALYQVEALLTDKEGNVIDRFVGDTGLRVFGFNYEGQFILNGQPLKLRGVCRHQDMQPIGPALSDEMHRRDMLIAKDLGANFIRISHYPQDPAILEMADKLGLLVWEEIPIIDIVPDDPDYARNAELNLREMIARDYNHPSVIMWGYMNEILLKVPGDDTEEGQKTVERTDKFVRRLESLCRALDPTRLTTMAFHGSDRYRTTGISALPMINGWNLYPGWYGGKLTGFEEFVSKERKANPAKPIIISEYGAGSDKRLHSQNPEPFDFSTEYQQKYIEHYIPVIEDSVFIAGASYWNLIDFNSALREESMPRINNKGLLYADRTPKDVYHYVKSAWRDDIDYVYIASRDYPVRAVVSNEAEVVVPIKIYSNTPKVNLLVNGKVYGDSIVKNHSVVFNVPLHAGGNSIIARGNNAMDAFAIDIQTIPERFTKANVDGVELAVNVGSNCSYVSPSSGLIWLADKMYTHGSWGRIGGQNKKTTVEMKGTADNPLFQSMAEGIEGYRFDLPEGDYEIELGFADPSGNSDGIAYLLGKEDTSSEKHNSFDIIIDDLIVEKAFSPSLANGHRFASKKKYHAKVKDGSLNLSFRPISGTPILNTIKIRKI